jgi:hypothetical protein
MHHPTWEEAKQASIQTWRQLAILLETGDVPAFRKALAAGWPLCARSQEDIQALGIPKVEMFQCDFCRGNLDYGGCGETVDAVLAAVEAGDLVRARREVDRVLATFEAMAFDVA